MSKRVDEILVERGLAPSLEKARALILAGEVWSKQTRLDKPGTKIKEDLVVEVRSTKEKFVSRAGDKLEQALITFKIAVDGRTCLDVGASTGGFTDCLLTHGAAKVFAVDVGHGQLDLKLQKDSRVINLEKTNARFMTQKDLSEKPSLITMDVSFISLKTIIPNLHNQFSDVKDWVLLFKPQFEVEPKYVEKGGIVRNQEAIQRFLTSFQQFMTGLQFECVGGPLESLVSGKKSGNVEFLFHFTL